MSMHASTAALIAKQPSGFALQQPFYTDETIFEREVDRIFLRSWLYVGHQSQIPAKGDYFLFEIAGESLIVVRTGEDEISAVLNVCRHRGSRVCLEASGHAKRFVCRYHGWTYRLNGSLSAAAHVDEAFDKSNYGLKRVDAEVFHGLIFVNFDADAAPFSTIALDLDDAMIPYGLGRAKVAHKANYPIQANWKLAVENYCECYHCRTAHPEYSKYHGRALPDEETDAQLAAVMERADQVGLTRDCLQRSWLDAGAIGTERGFERYALLGGCLTGSRDGKPLAPLLGDLRDYDGGATDIHIGPVTFFLAYCDHVVVYRFTPRTAQTTDCEITWLVNESAEEGKDYDLGALTWLWDVTTIADKEIIENNQAGVNSRFYEPGPYTEMEDFTRRFSDWYLEVIK